MDATAVVMLGLGVAILALVITDAFATMLSFRGGGPLSNRLMRAVWRVLMFVHDRRAIHGVLAITGPALAIGIVVLWLTLFSIGWLLVFLSGDHAVMVQATKESVDAEQTLYFVGATASSTGYGDLVPTRPPWTIVANVVAVSATFLVTVSLSYLMPVLSAALSRRQLAAEIRVMGFDSETIFRRAWSPDSSGAFDAYLITLGSEIAAHGQKHDVYPVLHYFHSPEPQKSPVHMIAVLADAVFLARLAEGRGSAPPAPTVDFLSEAIEQFVNQKRPSEDAEIDDEAIVAHLRSLARATRDIHGRDPRETGLIDDASVRVRAQLAHLQSRDGWRSLAVGT